MRPGYAGSASGSRCRSLIMRWTSPPSARPLVSRITAPDDRADRLVLARPDLLDGVRVVGDRAVHDRLELAALGAAEALAPRRSPRGRRPRPPARRAPPCAAPAETCFSPTIATRLRARRARASVPRGRRRRCAAASSFVTQLASMRASPLSLAATADSKKSPSSERKASRRAVSAGSSRSRSSRSARAAGSSGSAARARSSICLGRRDRHQVRLGEVAVVVRLLLGAQRREAPVCGSKWSVSCSTWPPLAAGCAPGARSPPRSRARGSGTSSCSSARSWCRAWPCRRGGSTRSRPSAASPPPCSRRTRPSAAAWPGAGGRTRRPGRPSVRSGSVTISTSGVPPRLKSTTLVYAPWMRPERAGVDQLRGVLLQVHAVDAHVAEAALPGKRDVVLADLVALRAGRDRSSSCGGRSSAGRSRTRTPSRSSARSAPPRRWSPAGCRGGRGRSGR